ncbi:MAG: hypothetical protein EOP84_09500 [Verrucomicrobiaceae bacterium]|nr:MAG: hypothetical protein EOP84_09500 [Verrucomicrobiaceae bacterium]
MVEGQHVKPWASLFEVSTYALGLWGLLYTMDIVLTCYVGGVGIPTRLFQSLVAYWLAANWLQGLWCFSFKPEFVQHLYIPTLLLAASSLSFGLAHGEITAFILEQGGSLSVLARGMLYAFRLPFSMHSVWMAAAALLNFNSWVAVRSCKQAGQLN